MPVEITHTEHGKGRVRLLKVTRRPDMHLVTQLEAEVLLEGPDRASFVTGDNAAVLPTDTVKNTVHALAKKHEFGCIEEFALILAKHFVVAHPSVIHKTKVKLVETQWDRLVTKDSKGHARPHHHAFVQGGTETRHATATAELRANGTVDMTLASGFTGLKVLKTTQSSFVGFLKDQYTTLPEVPDRLVSSSISAHWAYATPEANAATAAAVRAILLDVFAGPSDVGVASPAVQSTLFQMGEAVLARIPSICRIELYMPNIHNLPINLAHFGLPNLHPHGEVFLPTDEPHGMIRATLQRSPTSRL
ncbi:urate oxidase [Saprolegnia parasitica CBS 223.65]|uniref:Uricase n=1 Tax=Saprolegnia parasitica (strain CBS 223.65) TaxID=695850 RepID=A0A067C2V9_SAPPC|nr:urate oxidase [Saprolegnia parasitica CBS 223.65]KDO24853.1 urate oxidase [Saprolegnia parasitica CBS 223.65]|eukprot:XP_012204499.1 urate oxidase [Saprolegnia parasitica CBS 223.65]